jgi:dipeptidase D
LPVLQQQFSLNPPACRPEIPPTLQLTTIWGPSIFAECGVKGSCKNNFPSYPSQQEIRMSGHTARILEHFEHINSFPRCSKDEARLGRYLQRWAEERRLDTQCDPAGNLVVRVPAGPGYEGAPGVVLQGHLDMVCEKTPESQHDFTKDPIVSHQEGDWLTAAGTTLGADNGIAVAYMMALADQASPDAHPDLELLFTVDEETGLNGAKNLASDFIRGRMLINLDSEDEGVFTIGCAGGVDTHLTFEVQAEPIPNDAVLYDIVVGGLKGGHSGIDIHKHRGNANKILARTLAHIRRQTYMGLVTLSGGSRKNAIPRDARAIVWVEASGRDRVELAVRQMEATIRAELSDSDRDLFINATLAKDVPADAQTLWRHDTDRAIDVLLALPHGVADTSANMTGLVETSNNLATLELTDRRLCIVSSQRSTRMSRLDEITAKVHAIGRLAGARAEDKEAYPAWQPVMESQLLQKCQVLYRRLYNKDPEVQVIHAGLECAIIGDIYPGMDMISLGPTLRNAHSPDERLHIPSVAKVWDFLAALLAGMKS